MEYFKHIAELEKENAELKKRVDNQKSFLERIRAKFNLGEIDRKELEGYLESDQLTKAKEILHKVCYEFGIYDKDLMEEAKQFLNSEVEK